MMNKRCLALLLTVIMLLSLIQLNTWAEDTIAVSFTLMGDSCHGEEPHIAYEVWIDNETVECQNGATVYDVFTAVLDKKGYTYMGAEDGYVYGIITPAGKALYSFDNGPYSGWMYKVNDINPVEGLKDYVVSKGDSIVWYYTDDYVYGGEEITGTETTTEITTETTTESTTQTITKTETEMETEETTLEHRDNMPVVNAVTPAGVKVEWSVNIGGGTNIANPVIVDGNIYTVSKDKVYKLNTQGDIISVNALNKRVGDQYYIAYGDGKIFVQETGGVIQAFDGDTLESLWISEMPDSGNYGQGVTPIYYDNGYIYTGTVVTYGKAVGCYYAISTEDEDKERPDEVKEILWQFTPDVMGEFKGFYWAGAVIVGEAVIFGSEGGVVYSLDRYTGQVLDTYQAIGDIRCSISYKDGSIYFTTKSGYIYKVGVYEGVFGKAEYGLICADAIESTSTPVVYNDRIYVGAEMSGGTKGAVAVLDSNTLECIYTVDTDGKVQSTPLVSVNGDKLYIYVTSYNKPGNIVMLVDSRGQTEAKSIVLYSPEGEKGQYCINNVTADDNGKLYYQNDSGYMSALIEGVGGNTSGGGSGDSSSSENTENITVTFTLLGDSLHTEGNHSSFEYWITEEEYRGKGKTTAMDVLVEMLEKNGYSCVGAEDNYIKSITTPKGVTIGEFTNGPQSGWLFRVNGVIGEEGGDDYLLSDGDDIVWFYTDDYTLESYLSGRNSGSSGGDVTTETTTLDKVAAEKEEDGETTTDGVEDINGIVFTDVENDSWAAEYIYYLADRGIIKGRGNGLFAPENNITRGELVNILYCISGKGKEYDVTDYEDVSMDRWYHNAVQWASEMGIVYGVGDMKYSPNEYITREDISAILYRYVNVMKYEYKNVYSVNIFDDNGDISHYAKDAVVKLQQWGIINGMGNNKFVPKGYATRAQCCRMIAEILMENINL